MMASLMPIFLIFVVFYLFIIRPQNKKQKEHLIGVPFIFYKNFVFDASRANFTNRKDYSSTGASAGQTFAQLPQLMQASVILYAIVTLLLFDFKVHNELLLFSL